MSTCPPGRVTFRSLNRFVELPASAVANGVQVDAALIPHWVWAWDLDLEVTIDRKPIRAARKEAVRGRLVATFTL